MSDSPDNRYGTGYIESEAVLAMTAEDPEYAQSKLDKMSETELRRFSLQLDELITMIRQTRRDRFQGDKDEPIVN